MSKSDPFSAIFMEDSEADVNEKINLAYCKSCEVYDDKGDFINPIMDYTKSIIFGAYDTIEIVRTPQNGGNRLLLNISLVF